MYRGSFIPSGRPLQSCSLPALFREIVIFHQQPLDPVKQLLDQHIYFLFEGLPTESNQNFIAQLQELERVVAKQGVGKMLANYQGEYQRHVGRYILDSTPRAPNRYFIPFPM